MTENASQMTEYLPVILPLVWAVILALSVFLYVLLGGYDLGLGVLFPLAPSDKDRDAMMASVAPFWDGNETWLVLGGIGLLAAFPLAYSVMLPGLYIPIILMLMGLILRGVAFEFRFKSERYRWTWDLAFSAGSVLAALMQGAILGAFIQGFAVKDNQFAGGPFDWLSPFSIMTAIALLSGYVLLSTGWLIMKADEALREWAYGIAYTALIAVAAFIAIFSLWTPFLLGAALFLLSYTGLAVSLFPFIIPPDITIWQAAAAPKSQLFMLYGTIPLLPIILGYTAYSYYALWEAPDHDAYH